MKKVIALFAVTTVLCSFASCGQDPADEVPEESSATSVEEVSEEETTEEITESEKEEVTESETSETESETEDVSESTDEPSENLSADSSYEDAINMFIDCMNNKDIEGLMKLSFPDKYIDTMKFFVEISGGSLDELTMSAEESGENLRLVEIVSAEPMSSEDMDMLKEMYGSFELINQYVEQNGKDNIDEEKLEEFISESDSENLPEPYFEISDGQIVNCMIEYEYENGETETSESELMMYYIDGEGWKTDMSLMGYVKKSKQASINSSAKSIINAANVSLTDLDVQGVEIPDCIVSSDHTKNYNVSDDFVSQLEEGMEAFFPDYKDYDYFIVIKNGVADYLAVNDPENPKYTGTYPAEKVYSVDGEYTKKDKNLTFDEIYQSCLDEIQNQ